MASQMHRALSWAIVAVAAIALAGVTEAKFRGVNQFCRTADHRGLCTAMVHGATTLNEASANAIRAALAFATGMNRYLPIVDSALVGVPEPTKSSIASTCKDGLDFNVENLRTALDYIGKGDLNGANSYLSSTSLTDCSDSFEQFGIKFPLTKIAAVLDRQISNCLAVTQQI